MICRVCRNDEGNAEFLAKEIMYGLKKTFKYATCGKCGSLSSIAPPEDLSAYYPAEYYSYSNKSSDNGPLSRLVQRIRDERNSSYFCRSFLGRCIASYYVESTLRAISRLRIRRDSRILDVGCGGGRLLLQLQQLGFRNLVGVDPYLGQVIKYPNGIRIHKCNLAELSDRLFDVIMFHHSIEHVPDPVSTLASAVERLGPGGQILIRLPVAARAWKNYAENWVQLDAPRHFWIPTEKAMRMLASSTGLEVTQIDYDSDAFQFWGSELCIRGLPIERTDPRSEFTRSQLRTYAKLAENLNRQGEGDQAAFCLEAT